jgi:hypothetical protein
MTAQAWLLAGPLAAFGLATIALLFWLMNRLRDPGTLLRIAPTATRTTIASELRDNNVLRCFQQAD